MLVMEQLLCSSLPHVAMPCHWWIQCNSAYIFCHRPLLGILHRVWIKKYFWLFICNIIFDWVALQTKWHTLVPILGFVCTMVHWYYFHTEKQDSSPEKAARINEELQDQDRSETRKGLSTKFVDIQGVPKGVWMTFLIWVNLRIFDVYEPVA